MIFQLSGRGLSLLALSLLLASCHKPSGDDDHGHAHEASGDHGHGDEHGDDHGEEDGHGGGHADPHGDDHHGDGHSDEGGHEEGGHGHGALSYTDFSALTELFVEFPPLVVGAPAPFAAHLTHLKDFSPVAEGTVTVRLHGGGAPDERFTVSEAATPGIFRPVATPAHAGKRQLTLSWTHGDEAASHPLGEVEVYAKADQVPHLAPEAPGDEIAFLKEQQWKIAFATEAATPRPLRPSSPAFGTLRGRADGEVQVSAPAPGRLVTSGADFPRLGAEVASDQRLVLLAPAVPGEGGDQASLQLQVDRARLQLEHDTLERTRLEGLLAAGAVSERRYIHAKHSVEEAAASLAAAERRLHQFLRVQRRGGGGDVITLRTPLAGTIVAVGAAPGAFVEAGQALFHVIDLDRLWVEVRVPEANVGKIQAGAGLWFEVEGFEAPFEVGPEGLVAAGGVVDPRSRTVPYIFELPNPGRSLRAGMSVRAHLYTAPPAERLSVPWSAVIDEGGAQVVYVLTGGESFERRVVTLGVREGRHVAVEGGLSPGERVVSEGAWAVKLAASAEAAPGHGHAH